MLQWSSGLQSRQQVKMQLLQDHFVAPRCGVISSQKPVQVHPVSLQLCQGPGGPSGDSCSLSRFNGLLQSKSPPFFNQLAAYTSN